MENKWKDFSENEYEQFLKICNDAREFQKEVAWRAIDYTQRSMAVVDNPLQRLIFLGDKSGKVFRFDLDEILKNPDDKNAGVIIVDKLGRNISALEIVSLKHADNKQQLLAVGSEDNILRCYSLSETPDQLLSKKMDGNVTGGIQFISKPYPGGPVFISSGDGTLHLLKTELRDNFLDVKEHKSIPDLYITALCIHNNGWLWFGTRFGDIWCVNIKDIKDVNLLKEKIQDVENRKGYYWTGENVKRIFNISQFSDIETSLRHYHTILCMNSSRVFCFRYMDEDGDMVKLDSAVANIAERFFDLDLNRYPKFEDQRIYFVGGTYNNDLYWIQINPDAFEINKVFSRRQYCAPLKVRANGIAVFPYDTEDKQYNEIAAHMVLASGDKRIVIYQIRDERTGFEKIKRYLNAIVINNEKNIPAKGRELWILGTLARRYHGCGESETRVQEAILRLLTDYIDKKMINLELREDAYEFRRCIGWLLSTGNLRFSQVIRQRLYDFVKRKCVPGSRGLMVINELLSDIQNYFLDGASFSERQYQLLELTEHNKEVKKRFDAGLYASILCQRRYDMIWMYDLRPSPFKYTLKINCLVSVIVRKDQQNQEIFFACATSDGNIHLFIDDRIHKKIRLSPELNNRSDITGHEVSSILCFDEKVLFFFFKTSVIVSVNCENLLSLLKNTVDSKDEFTVSGELIKLNFENGHEQISCVLKWKETSFVVGTTNGHIYWFQSATSAGKRLHPDQKYEQYPHFPVSSMSYADINSRYSLLLAGFDNGTVCLIKVSISNHIPLAEKELDRFLYDSKGISAVHLTPDARYMIIGSAGGLNHFYRIHYEDTGKTQGIERSYKTYSVISGFDSGYSIINIKSLDYRINVYSKPTAFFVCSNDGYIYLLSSETKLQTAIRLSESVHDCYRSSGYQTVSKESFPLTDLHLLPSGNENIYTACTVIGASTNGRIFCFRLIKVEELERDYCKWYYKSQEDKDLSESDISDCRNEYDAALAMGADIQEHRLNRWLVRGLKTNKDADILLRKTERLLNRGEYIDDTPVLFAHLDNLFSYEFLKKLLTYKNSKFGELIWRVLIEWGQPGSEIRNYMHLFTARAFFHNKLELLINTRQWEDKSLLKLTSLVRHYLNYPTDFIRYMALQYLSSAISNTRELRKFISYEWLLEVLLEPLENASESYYDPNWVNLAIIRALSKLVTYTDLCPMYIAYRLMNISRQDHTLMELLISQVNVEDEWIADSSSAVEIRHKICQTMKVYSIIRKISNCIEQDEELSSDMINQLTIQCKNDCFLKNKDQQNGCQDNSFRSIFIKTYDAFAESLKMDNIEKIAESSTIFQQDTYGKSEFYKVCNEILVEFAALRQEICNKWKKVSDMGRIEYASGRNPEVDLLLKFRKNMESVEYLVYKREDDLGYMERGILCKMAEKWHNLIDEECRGNTLIRFLRGMGEQAERIERTFENGSGQEYTLDIRAIFKDLFDRFCLRLRPEYGLYVYRDPVSGKIMYYEWQPLQYSFISSDLATQFPLARSEIKENIRLNISDLLSEEYRSKNISQNRINEIVESVVKCFPPEAHVVPLILENHPIDFPALFIFWKASGTVWLDRADRVLFEGIPKFVLATNLLLIAIRKNEEAYKEVFRIAAHQLESPLLALRYKVQEVLDEGYLIPGTEEYTKYMSRVSSLVEECLTNVRNILNVRAFLVGQSLPVTIEDNVDFFSLMDSVVRNVRDQFRKTHVVIEFDRKRFREESETFDLRTDVDKLKDIIKNILANACKYSQLEDNPRIVITGRYNYRKKKFFIEVEDNGIGIPWEELDLIYDPFFRGKLAEANNIDGYGVGLFISKIYATRLGGNLVVYNNNKNTRKGIKARLEISNFVD